MRLLKDSKFSKKICQIKRTAYVRNPLQIDLILPEIFWRGDWLPYQLLKEYTLYYTNTAIC